jgi:integrase
MGIKVTLRKKKISKGRLSLYLDFYPAIENIYTGQMTRREFLGQYIWQSPKTPSERANNKDTIEIAEDIRHKRQNILNKPEVYNEFEKRLLHQKRMSEVCTIQYFEKLALKRNGTNVHNWQSAFLYYKDFLQGDSLSFEQLNESICEDFKEYLLNTPSRKSEKQTLSINSAKSYFDKFKVILKQAYKDGHLQVDLNARLDCIKEEETHREFLDQKELNQLASMRCAIPVVKNAGLFSALTGLRFSDIQQLKWKEVIHIDGQGYYIRFKQQKTGGAEMMPISDDTYNYLGNPGDPDDDVFAGLDYYDCSQNPHFKMWLNDAGITKKFTFHCFRHTFAVLQLMSGTDIYTVSKMLGHRSVKTTMIYAKVVDEMKRSASEKIKINNNYGRKNLSRLVGR